MKKTQRIKLSNKIGKTTKIILLIVASFWFLFALVSGSEGFGGGIRGIIINSPNAIPWAILLIITYVAWKKELIGGILIVVLGIVSMVAFRTYREMITFLLISISLFLLGAALIVSWYLKKK